MRTRRMRVPALVAATALLFAGCAADDDVDDLDAGFEDLDDDANDTEPLDAEPDPDEDATVDAGDEPTAVAIVDNEFDPPELAVEAGDTVTWTNDGSADHNVTGDAFASDGDLSSGEVFEFTFEDAGTYEYQCTIHEGMSGEIVVG